MSENQVLNSTPSDLVSKPSPTRRIPTSPKSSSQMEAALDKQKQILEQYKEANDALTKYKEKTEQSIIQSKKDLEEEKKKTSDMINDISMKNEEIINERKLDNNKKIQELKESPLFESEPIQSMKNSFVEMKSDVEGLKADFSQNFQNFMNDVHAIHSQILSQKNEKQNSLNNNNANNKMLEVSEDSVSHDEMSKDVPVTIEKSIEIKEEAEKVFKYTPHLTAFLKRYAIENAKWLA